jgi:poly-gamma-glutamate capsule biosynthesis protein CapA/YwtB (metallophosphatase superfamily)
MPPRFAVRRISILGAALVALAACVESPRTAAPRAVPLSPAVTSTVPLVLVTHATVDPPQLDAATARRVLSGSVTNWRSLGKADAPLRFVAGPSASSLIHAGARRAASDAVAIRAVEDDPGAIAAVAATSVRPTVQALSVDGIDPLRDPNAYPLAVPGRRDARVVAAFSVGDIMLGRRVGAELERTGDFTEAFRWTGSRLAAHDLTFANLESTLSRAGLPRQGNDSFGASSSAVEGLRFAGIDAVSLANNHSGDFGPRALIRTHVLLRRSGIEPIGAGATETVARRAVVIDRGGVRFGFLAFNSIGETPAANGRRPGAVTLRIPPRFPRFVRSDLAQLTEAIGALRRRVDVVVVLPHWGRQYTGRQDSYQRLVARTLARAGADVVIGSHPHWVQGMEMIGSTFVAYSLGNFIFDMDWSRATREGLALELIFWGPELMAVHPIPVRIDERFRPRFLTGDAAQQVLRRVWQASSPPLAQRP